MVLASLVLAGIIAAPVGTIGLLIKSQARLGRLAEPYARRQLAEPHGESEQYDGLHDTSTEHSDAHPGGRVGQAVGALNEQRGTCHGLSASEVLIARRADWGWIPFSACPATR
jgi:hypothetical protein